MAVEVLGKALTLQRPGSQLLNSLALSYHQLGELDKAKPLLERSLEVDPDQPKIRELLELLSGDVPPGHGSGAMRAPPERALRLDYG